MIILITGVGNVGKSSFRRMLVRVLREHGVAVEHSDADGFSEVRNARDRGMIDVRETTLDSSTVYLIEDVHGTQAGSSLLPMSSYDLVFYLRPSYWTHVRFWLSRAWRWFSHGVYDWQPIEGFKGTKVHWDVRNVPAIMNVVSDQLGKRIMIDTDLVILSKEDTTTIVIEPRWTKNGPVFDPPDLDLFK